MDRITGPTTIDIGNGRRGFRKRDAVAGQNGTEVKGEWLNSTQEEIMAVIEAAGLKPDPDDWAQIARAMQSDKLNLGTALGTANDLIINMPLAPAEPHIGMPVHFRALQGNTGPVTVKVGEYPRLPMVRPDGTSLLINDLLPDAILSARYRGDAWQLVAVAQQAPQPLSQPLTLWARSDGSDDNDGSDNTPDQAFATPQGAYDYARANYTSAGQEITIRLGIPGTYPGLVHDTMSGTVKVEGDIKNRSNYIITGSPRTPASCFHIASGGMLHVTGVTIQMPDVSGSKSVWAQNGTIRLIAIHHKTTGISGGLYYHVVADALGFIHMNGSHEYTGNNDTDKPINAFVCATGGKVYLGSQADRLYLNVYNNPTHSIGFAYSDTCGAISVRSAAISGGATGPRYYVFGASFINSSGSGENFFPGSSPGSANKDSGGFFV